jgi:Ca2+-binding EF-hand superfamily protein
VAVNLDKDNDGYVRVAEIKEACAVDVNGDGFISEEERMQGAQAWLGALEGQDLDDDQRLTLHELLLYNNNAKQAS